MGLMKELNALNDIYQKMYVTEVSADKALEASKKADIARGKAAAAGDKETAKAKAGQAARLYKAQAKKRLNKEDYETKKTKEVISALDREKPGKRKKPLSSADKKKIANKVVTSKGDTSKSDDRYAYEEVSPELTKLIESGKFSEHEINLLVWNEFDEGYQRNPEKGEAEAKKADKRSAKQKRMDDPEKGINSPAFKEFMRSRGM